MLPERVETTLTSWTLTTEVVRHGAAFLPTIQENVHVSQMNESLLDVWSFRYMIFSPVWVVFSIFKT